MSKRKVKKVKGSKITSKKQKISASSMEKLFLAQPSKISVQYRKELAILASHEKKMVKELKKLETKHQSIKAIQAKLLAKSTPTSKKQITANNKVMKMLNNTMMELNNALNQLKKQNMQYTQKQIAFANLDKQLLKLMSAKTSVKKPRKTLRNPTKKADTLTPNAETIEIHTPASSDQTTETVS